MTLDLHKSKTFVNIKASWEKIKWVQTIILNGVCLLGFVAIPTPISHPRACPPTPQKEYQLRAKCEKKSFFPDTPCLTCCTSSPSTKINRSTKAVDIFHYTALTISWHVGLKNSLTDFPNIANVFRNLIAKYRDIFLVWCHCQERECKRCGFRDLKTDLFSHCMVTF